MSAVATRDRLRSRAQTSEESLSERLLAALPLVAVYVWLCLVYMWEAWSHVSPWLFTDELEMTQYARSIADTGHPARRGVAHAAGSLYPYLTAPAWWLHSVGAAYSSVKYLDVLVMTAVVFPTYALARLVVGRRAALFAAAAAGIIPSLAYTSLLVEENLAYPYAALCFFLIAKALVELRRSHRGVAWAAGALSATLVAPAVRQELLMIPVTLLLALVFAAWTSPWARERRRRTWSRGDFVGAVTLAFGAIFLVSGFLSHHVPEWYEVTTYYKHRQLVLLLWAAGAFAIGVGVVPVVAGLAALVPVRGERTTRELRLFRCVSLAGIVAFCIYTAAKATYLANHFAMRVEERNIIYVAPLVFVGAALWVERRRVNPWALGAAAALTLWLIVGTPLHMDVQLYSDALGLAILQQANRYLYWTPTTAQWVLLVVLVAGTAALAAPRFVRRERAVTALAVVVAVFCIAWGATAEFAAATGSNSLSRTAAASLRQPYDWVDRIANGKPTLYLGQGVADPSGAWLLEFWNRSIVSVGSLDGTIGGPGPAGGPNIAANGETYWTSDVRNPGREYDFAVEEWPCVDFAGTLRKSHAYAAGAGAGRLRHWRLVELTHPNRLQAMCSNIYGDGWSGAIDSAYYRFGGATRAGWMRISVSRAEWGGAPQTSPVHVLVGKLRIDANHQPRLGRITARRDWVVHSGQPGRVFWLRVPGPRFAATVVVDDKFVPRDLDPSLSDPRQLGAVVSYRYVASRPRNAAHK